MFLAILGVMIPSSLRPPLEAFAERLRRAFGARLREVRLFGSYARGEAHEESDVDVLVVIDDLTSLEIGQVGAEAAPVIAAMSVALAPLPMSTAHFADLRRQGRPLALDLDREGIAL